MIPNIVCSTFKIPKVAICIAGASRTFETELVYKTIKHNLIDSFGGKPTVFAYLKTKDARGDNNPRCNGLILPNKEKILEAIKYIEIDKQNYILENNANTSLPPGLTKISRPDYELSLAGQLANKKKVIDIMINYENENKMTFDFIIIIRPDLSWPYPCMPFCMYDLSICRKKHDWVLFFPRDKVEKIVNIPYNKYYNCEELLIKKNSIEHYIFSIWKDLGINMCEDVTLSAILTRKNKENMPSNMGRLLINYSNVKQDPVPYLEMTCKNKFVDNDEK